MRGKGCGKGRERKEGENGNGRVGRLPHFKFKSGNALDCVHLLCSVS